MKHMIIKFFAIGLIATFLGVNAWLPFQMIGHAKTHAHHHSATHTTPLCTLLCSAGQIAHNADPTPEFALSYAFNLEPPIFISYHAIRIAQILARGPPTS